MWIKQAYRDYYKPKLKRTLKRDPSQEEMDQRFEEIYSQVNCILLAGVLEGVAIYFYEIAKISKEELDGFRDRPEEYLFERFGGGNYKLNFFEGPPLLFALILSPRANQNGFACFLKKQEQILNLPDMNFPNY